MIGVPFPSRLPPVNSRPLQPEANGWEPKNEDVQHVASERLCKDKYVSGQRTHFFGITRSTGSSRSCVFTSHTIYFPFAEENRSGYSFFVRMCCFVASPACGLLPATDVSWLLCLLLANIRSASFFFLLPFPLSFSRIDASNLPWRLH